MINLRRSFIDENGAILPIVLAFILASTILTGAVLTVIQTNFFTVNLNTQRQQALNIAEAGVNYYLWHMSHDANDFKDGQSTPATPDPDLGYGPYVHNYVDDNSKTTGTYTLWIKPQSAGSTIMTVRSIGKVKNTNVIRTVDAQIGATSFASYALASDSALWFGNTEVANGPVHSNVGVRMDGASFGDVTSANATYVPPGSLGGDGASHPGVWCKSSVTTPVNCNSRSKADWHYPVPLLDFNQISSSLCTIKKVAFSSDATTSALSQLSNACSQTPTTRTPSYLPQRSASGSFSSTQGYLIELNTNGTYNLYNVNSENDTKATYVSALGKSLVSSNVVIPSTGVIFAEDNVWIRSNPTYKGRVTIGSGRLAQTNSTDIVIADDLVYTTKNGDDAIGLVTENSVIIAPYAPPASGAFTFEVDASMIAQSGSVTYPLHYRSTPSKYTHGWINSNQKFIFYGSISTRQTWTWTWLIGCGSCADAVYSASNSAYISGILNNSTDYDYNLLYAPPPNYPITGGYNILSWREVLTTP